MQTGIKFKISLIILIFSIILPFVASKLSTSKFSKESYEEIISFELPPSFNTTAKKEKADLISDPFRLKQRVDTLEKDKAAPTLKMVYKGKHRYALIGDNCLREGEKLGEYKVKKILLDKVLLVDKKGEELWLKLEN
ncbi:hypothetical protein [Thermodesulfovibrio sp.]|uniref:hypothetical protein n=1 Tax=Thermodesulfovibrio sp. TaxID=2067987 RepID=UPI00309F34F5